jgi:hypothetical protein
LKLACAGGNYALPTERGEPVSVRDIAEIHDDIADLNEDLADLKSRGAETFDGS